MARDGGESAGRGVSARGGVPGRAARAMPSSWAHRFRGRLDVIGFALLAYVPFLLSSPGQVSADTKHYFYLDPERLLERAPSLWDPHIGTGTVPHQNVGFLFPTGPYYWVMDNLGVPDWVAQRLWLGTLSFVAALGMLWLLQMLGARRIGAIAAALVYMLTPYQLAFTARLSVLLIPWALLPWLVGLTARALKDGGWRYPALFALLVLPAGSSNATSLLLAGIAPVMWLVFAVIGRQATARAALVTTGKIGLLATGVSLWWASGLVAQSRYGIPILDVTETVQTVSSASNPADLLRGLGNWFFLGSDRLGRWLDQSAAYAERSWLSIATFAVPGVALLAAAVTRWRHRAYFAALIVVGVIIGVGAWPYDDPSPVGSAFKSAAGSSAFGLALRNTPRVVPIVVLGVAGLIAAGVTALAVRRRLEIVAAGVVCLCVVVSFSPVWETGYLSDRADRPEDIPAYTFEATDALGDSSAARTRVLELPGALFGAYRWGYTVDPITPGLTDRPWIGRELPPYGSAASVDLLAALDRRVQDGTFEPASLAAIARLMRAGTIFVRSDLEYERFESPRPRLVWAMLTDPLAPGLAEPEGYGPAKPNRAQAQLAMFDELELASSGREWPPELARFEVSDVPSLVDTAPVRTPVVVAGSGDGLVDAAAAGLLDGNELILYSASLDDAELRDALARGADLVLTDSNRRRARRWNSLRDETGMTERAGQEARRDDTDDFRLDPFSTGDRERTVVEHHGGRVDATGYGFTGLYRPEDRPAQAFDGDERTSWRVAGGLEAGGERLVLRPDEPVRTDFVTLVQPLDAPNGRWITKVRLHFDRGQPVTVDLDETSRTDDGQAIGFSERTIRRFEIEVLETSPGVDGVGFAEVELGGVQVDEVVRVPVALLERVGESRDHRLVVVLSRERYEPADVRHRDEELRLVREVTIDAERAFLLTGTARVNPAAPPEVVDRVLGTTGADDIDASGHLGGILDARASMAFDGDLSTAWTSPIGAAGSQYLEADATAAVTIDRLDLDLVADGRHSVPTRLQLVVDGVAARTIDLPAVTDGAAEQSTQAVSVEFEPVTGRSFSIVIDAARPVPTTGDYLAFPVVAPVAIAEVHFDGAPVVQHATDVPSGCRDDLLTVDDEPVSIRVSGPAGDARRGLQIEPCGPPLVLDAGPHLLRAAPGRDTGIDLDRLVLTSARGGGPGQGGADLGASEPSGSTARVIEHGATARDVRVRTDGRPFWLVLGESDNAGWKATTGAGDDLGEPRLVDGFANGWLVEPDGAGTMHIALRWTPQNVVWIGMAVSVVAIVACIAVLWLVRRRAAPADALADAPVLASPLAFDAPAPTLRASLVVGALTAVAAGVASRPWIGVLVGAAAFLACREPRARILLLAGAPLTLAAAKLGSEPELGWITVLLLGADVVCAEVRRAAVRRGGARAPAGR